MHFMNCILHHNCLDIKIDGQIKNSFLINNFLALTYNYVCNSIFISIEYRHLLKFLQMHTKKTKKRLIEQKIDNLQAEIVL